MLTTVTNKKAARNLWQTVLVGGLMLWLLVFLDQRVAYLITGQKPENHLEIHMVDFEGGKFRQIVSPTGGEAMQANWSASIFRKDDFICGGGGNGTYRQRTEPARFTPDQWTGDDCSAMVPGLRYRAEVSWEYRTRPGEWHQVSAVFSFTYKEAQK